MYVDEYYTSFIYTRSSPHADEQEIESNETSKERKNEINTEIDNEIKNENFSRYDKGVKTLRIASISCGDFHSAAVSRCDKLYTWGSCVQVRYIWYMMYCINMCIYICIVLHGCMLQLDNFVYLYVYIYTIYVYFTHEVSVALVTCKQGNMVYENRNMFI